jgi:transcriptional regulator with XRE-family HTH domain
MENSVTSTEHVPASLRALRGLTQDGLRKKAKIGRSTLVKIENGDKSVGLAQIEKVAKVLRVRTDELVRAMEREASRSRVS